MTVPIRDRRTPGIAAVGTSGVIGAGVTAGLTFSSEGVAGRAIGGDVGKLAGGPATGTGIAAGAPIPVMMGAAPVPSGSELVVPNEELGGRVDVETIGETGIEGAGVGKGEVAGKVGGKESASLVKLGGVIETVGMVLLAFGMVNGERFSVAVVATGGTSWFSEGVFTDCHVDGPVGSNDGAGGVFDI